MKRLSEKQNNIINFIEQFIEEHDYPPTIRDIQHGCDISSTSVVKYNLDRLSENGLLTKDSEVSRGIAIPGSRTLKSNDIFDVVSVPLMGTIAAGSPIPLPHLDSWSDPSIESIQLPQSVLGTDDNVYALRVSGESMIDALIGDGDMVIMKAQQEVRNGQMAAIRLIAEEETTLKFYYSDGSKIRLQPANSQMKPIIADAENVEVMSKVVAVWRYFG